MNFKKIADTSFKRLPFRFSFILTFYSDVNRDLWREWPIGLKRCNPNQKVFSSKPARLGLGNQSRYEASSDLLIKKMQ